MADIIVYVLSGTVLGFFIGLTGVGGGVLTVPVLMVIMRLQPIEAVGTASLYAVLTKIWAAIRHYRQDTLNVRTGIRFLRATLPGVILGALAVKWSKASLSPEGVETLQEVVSYVVIASACLALAALILDHSRFKNGFFPSRRGKGVQLSCVFLIGVLMGVTSIGGGILIIPALLLFYRETSKFVGTSIFIALLCMAAMSCMYAFIGGGGHSDDVNLRVAAFMSVGSLVGAHCGVSLSKRIGPKRLQGVVIAVILLAVIVMLLDKVL